MTFSWSETKDILPKSVKDSKVTHWLMERAHEEGMRPVDVVLTSAQNKSAIKDLMERLSSTARAVMSMWWAWPTLGNRPSSMQSSKKSLETRISSRPLASQGRHWTRSKSHWTMDPTSMIHQGLSIATRWLITWQQKILSMSALKRKSSLRLINSIQSKPSFGWSRTLWLYQGRKARFHRLLW